jgi:hypothetical protein
LIPSNRYLPFCKIPEIKKVHVREGTPSFPFEGVPGFKGPAEAKYPELPKWIPSPNILLNI